MSLSPNDAIFLTHDGGVWVARDRRPALNVFGQIAIGSNTFVGIGTTILPGVTIGNNCVIGARSVVTKDIPDDSVVVGTPAWLIGNTKDYIERILLSLGRVDTKGVSAVRQREILLVDFPAQEKPE
jgi:acetyltransferase-like isoleucine patch superfamily enzyme